MWRKFRWILIVVIACMVIGAIPHWILGLIAICILWPVPDWIKRHVDKGDKRNAA